MLSVLVNAIKVYGGVDVWLHSFFTQALDGGQWRASFSSHFTPEDRRHSTNYVEGWMDLRAI